jgi:hypothetical protein
MSKRTEITNLLKMRLGTQTVEFLKEDDYLKENTNLLAWLTFASKSIPQVVLHSKK